MFRKMFYALSIIALVWVALASSAMPTLAQGPKPAPPAGATQLAASADNDKLVADLAKALGLTNTAYEAWQLPADANWDGTFKYYSDQMAQAGWGGQGASQDFPGGKVGVWINQETNTALVIFFVASSGTVPSYNLAIFGTLAYATATKPPAPKPPAPKPPAPAGATQIGSTPDWDKLVGDFAQSIGWKEYAYEAWQRPATTTWDDTFKYYNDQMIQAGWNGQGVTQDFTGGKVGVWINPDTKSGLVIIFIASPDGTQPALDLAVIGK